MSTVVEIVSVRTWRCREWASRFSAVLFEEAGTAVYCLLLVRPASRGDSQARTVLAEFDGSVSLLSAVLSLAYVWMALARILSGNVMGLTLVAEGRIWSTVVLAASGVATAVYGRGQLILSK